MRGSRRDGAQPAKRTVKDRAASPGAVAAAASPGAIAAADGQLLVDRLAHLSTIVPVFAKELISARRLLSLFRAENRWLMQELSSLEGAATRRNASTMNGPEDDRSTHGGDTEVHGDRIRYAHSGLRKGSPAGQESSVAIVELTADQSARIEALSEDCTIIGAERGLPLVRQAGGEVALLEGDGRLAPLGHEPKAVSGNRDAVAS